MAASSKTWSTLILSVERSIRVSRRRRAKFSVLALAPESPNPKAA